MGPLPFHRSLRSGVQAALVLAVALLTLSASNAGAVPAFAVQVGVPCESCHIGGFGPQLTPFGREFKMKGYTTRTNSWNVPFSAMAVASYVQTRRDQADPPAPGYGVNDNSTLDQASIFLAGGLGNHLGAFVQTTWDGVARVWHWDNLDVRTTTTATVGGSNLVLGLSFNNAPSVQDAWNTLPSWRFPYTTSSLQPGPGASPLIGSLAQNTLGLTGYVWINSSLLVEAGGYQSPGANFLTRLGVDPLDPGNISGTAPYLRVAYQKNWGDKNLEVGGFGMWTNLNPGRDVSTGFTDHYGDMGLDATFQYNWPNKSVFTLNTIYTHESQGLDASQALGLAQNREDNLNEFRLDAAYYWKDYIGLTIGGFDTWGSTDNLLYAGNRTFTPNSSGLVFQIDGTPFGGPGSPLGKRFNLRMGIQYFLYTKFDGASSNYDGMGGNASDNNTFRFFTWAAF
jgi:hypothetical protein